MNKKRIQIIITILLCLLFIVAAFISIRFRGSTPVHAKEDILPEREIVFYRQDDERWAQETLGDSKYTMEKSGCLVCCIASAVSMTDKEKTPQTLNDEFSLQNVFDAEGNIVWGNLNSTSEYHAEIFQGVSEEILEECLKNGRYPIVRVRMYGIGNFHYVLIVKAEEGMFYCMDPLQAGLIPLSQYGNRIYAVRLVYLTDK